MIYDNITVLLADGRSGSHAIYMWLLNNMEDTFGMPYACPLIYTYPFGKKFIDDYAGENNLLFRAEFISAFIQNDEIFKFFNMDTKEVKNVLDLCDNLNIFMILRDFYNYIASWISLIKTKQHLSENQLAHKVRIWKERADRYIKNDVHFILYNEWDKSESYRKSLKSIFSDKPVNDQYKSDFNCTTENFGLASGFETDTRHQRFKELTPEEFKLFERIIDENPDLCELSDQIFGKVYS